MQNLLQQVLVSTPTIFQDLIAFPLVGGLLTKLFDRLFPDRIDEEVKKSQIDEKRAMIYKYANDVKKWKKEGDNATFVSERIVADILAMGRIRKIMDFEQKAELNKALICLIDEMRKDEYGNEANRIETVSKSLSFL